MASSRRRDRKKKGERNTNDFVIFNKTSQNRALLLCLQCIVLWERLKLRKSSLLNISPVIFQG